MFEHTVDDVERGRIPTADESVRLGKITAGAEHVFMGAPIAADDNRIVTSVDWADGALAVAAQPDVPRNLTVALTDADNSVTGLMTITGVDAAGRTVVETMEPDGAGAGKALTGTKIFARVDSVVISDSAGEEAGVDVVIVGVGDVIGVPVDLDLAAEVRHVYLAAVRQASPTVATGVSTSGVDASAGTYDGAKLMWSILKPGALS